MTDAPLSRLAAAVSAHCGQPAVSEQKVTVAHGDGGGTVAVE